VGPMQHPYHYSGGLKLSLLTWIRRAVIFPSASTWAATNTYSPGFKNEGSAGIVVPMGVPTGTRIFWVLPVYSSVSSCPLAVWTTAITLALVIIVSGCKRQGIWPAATVRGIVCTSMATRAPSARFIVVTTT